MPDTLNQVEFLRQRVIALEAGLQLFLNATSSGMQIYIDIARNHAEHLLRVAPVEPEKMEVE
jgi:hypothetical protein